MTIAIGDQAPDFTLPTAGGGSFTLSEALADGPVVLVFFPLAFSGICQGELCEIRDNLAEFDDARVRVVACSIDSPYSLGTWAEQQGYTFTLASDMWPHGEVAQRYGVFVPERGIATRASFLIRPDGVVTWSVVNAPNQARPLEGYREALAAL